MFKLGAAYSHMSFITRLIIKSGRWAVHVHLHHKLQVKIRDLIKPQLLCGEVLSAPGQRV